MRSWHTHRTQPFIYNCALIYNDIQRASTFVRAIEEHVLRAQYNGRQDRKLFYHFYRCFFTYDLTTSHLTAVHSRSTEAPRRLYCFRTRVTSAWRWGEVECASEKSPVWCDRKDALHLNKCNSCQEKKRDRSHICEWGGQPKTRSCVKYF